MAAVNLNSEDFCKIAYKNYYIHGNTMKLTRANIDEIEEKWGSKVNEWLQESYDEISYDLDDEGYNSGVNDGYDAAKKLTGHDGNLGLEKTEGALNNAATLATGVNTAIDGGINALSSINSTVKNLDAKAEWGGWSKNASKYIQAAAVIATTVYTKIAKPNEEAKEACDELQAGMLGATEELNAQQEIMDETREEIIKQQEEANIANEEANTKLVREDSQIDFYAASKKALEDKIARGEQLTESEKERYNTYVNNIKNANGNKENIASTRSNIVDESYNNIGSYQAEYDSAAQTMGEIEGLTDFAESIDETTQDLCYVEGASQTMNALSATMVTAKLLMGPWWDWIVAAATATAGVFSGIEAVKQFKWAGEVGNEIAARETVQGINTETMETLETDIDNANTALEDIDGMTFASEDTTYLENTVDTNANQSNEVEKKPKKEEQENK